MHFAFPSCLHAFVVSKWRAARPSQNFIDAVKQKAKVNGCRRLWLITTNDNLNALGFYQKKGFRLVALYPNALEASRKLKPEISLKASNGVPIRDELELELELSE